jgi:cellulose synthase/poly-beta-1,6-N-acetylglucosamine synthase-like glycosyltransferase
MNPLSSIPKSRQVGSGPGPAMSTASPSWHIATSARPLVSVVMPSWQSARDVRSALHALESQETAVPYEIIVVDSSTDGTDLIIKCEFPLVRLIHFSERRQVGTARNIGIEAARGDVILFVDADTIPCPTWIDQMYRAIRELGADGVGGAMSNGTPWSVSGSTGFYLEFARFLSHRGPPECARFLVGGNSGFRREILSGMSYSDRSLGEDMLFSSRLAKNGNRLLFLPAASVTHLNRTGWRTVLSYQHKLGQGAFFYRSQDSPMKVRLLRASPALFFLIPFVVVIRIGVSILWRRQGMDFLRFVVVLPLCLIGNAAWAFGFHGAMREATRGGSPE